MVTRIEPIGDRILMRGGSLVTGDGRTFLECASIRIRKGLIVEAMPGIQECMEGETVITTGGSLMLPGFINGHAHATILGPSMPSGSHPLPSTEVEWQRNRHLLSGTTSLINVCGLAIMDERDGILAPHPMDIHMTSAHTPHSISAADQVDGSGLSPRHRSARIEDLVQAGCRVLGEAGGGQTLGGGAQDYRFIPDAIEERTGQRITVLMARRLKEAVLGRRLDGLATASEAELMSLLEEAYLQDRIAVQELRSLIEERVFAPVKNALLGIEEIAEAATAFGLPAIFHLAAPTAATLISLKRRLPNMRMIAAHANHPSFLPDEAVETARQLKALGVTIDVSTLDVIDTKFRNQPDNLDALAEAGLVDTISTDYAGGDWDTIPSALHRMTRVSAQTLPWVVALATGNVARVFPEIFGDRGLIAPGKRADIIITDLHNVSKVRHVFIAGKAHILDGRF